MATLFSDLLTDLKADMGDPEGTLVPAAISERALIRALAMLNTDAETVYQIVEVNGVREVQPEMAAMHRELLLLRTRAMLAAYLRVSSTTTAVSFQSGDKRVDRRNTVSDWAELEKDLLAEYWRRLGKPAEPSTDVLRFDVRPRTYELGSIKE